MDNNTKQAVETPLWKRDLVKEHGGKIYRAPAGRKKHKVKPGVIVFRSVAYRVMPDGSVRRLQPGEETAAREMLKKKQGGSDG